ncbi:hypothetical protein PIB30_036672 [Stylosanthes scabra]|uniref:Uncharacterized protein n=1 Tax=Stylosanthes scabra TaxID=79078 RepID=A0ABU6WDM9_9FABA|nr:hypothetical protein [Stylosanthes scabra]
MKKSLEAPRYTPFTHVSTFSRPPNSFALTLFPTTSSPHLHRRLVHHGHRVPQERWRWRNKPVPRVGGAALVQSLWWSAATTRHWHRGRCAAMNGCGTGK